MDYPWYEIITNDDTITQGDILINCPIPVMRNIVFMDQLIQADIAYIDGIVLTQACELEQQKTDSLLLCEIQTLKTFTREIKSGSQEKNDSQITSLVETIRTKKQYAYSLLNNCEGEDFESDYYIVNFRNTYTIPLSVGKMLVNKNINNKRLRLLPPYREFLSQAFANYYMRVGLPADIDKKILQEKTKEYLKQEVETYDNLNIIR